MNRKIGFSEIGGIYIGEDIQTTEHIHYAITIAVSFSGAISFECEGKPVNFRAAVIQAATRRKFSGPEKNLTGFIHIEPFSTEGRRLTNRDKSCVVISESETEKILAYLHEWFTSDANNEQVTTRLIQRIVHLLNPVPEVPALDERIEKVMSLVRNSEQTGLKEAAQAVHLSPYRLSHLFRQQTCISFREFVLYAKLVRSLKAISRQQTLTESSHAGGFSDQSHFIRTYYKAFGILPSQSVK